MVKFSDKKKLHNKFENENTLSILLSVESGDDLVVENEEEARTLIEKIQPLVKTNEFFKRVSSQLNEYIICIDSLLFFE